MPLVYREGDLFSSTDLDGLAHGCNSLGVMGSGIATVFRRKWPDMYAGYKQLCSSKQLVPGDIFPYRDESGLWIYNLITQGHTNVVKPHWIEPAKLEYIEAAFYKMLVLTPDQTIGIPKIGAGLGGLEWEDIERTIQNCLKVTEDKTTIVVHILPEKE
jgi:O-acetyl-ADP-ribose deacetylase (regulator of RNase III)